MSRSSAWISSASTVVWRLRFSHCRSADLEVRGRGEAGAFPAGGLQHLADELDRGRLPVGAGHAQQAQARSRPAVEAGRQVRQRPARAGYHDLRDRDVDACSTTPPRRL